MLKKKIIILAFIIISISSAQASEIPTGALHVNFGSNQQATTYELSKLAWSSVYSQNPDILYFEGDFVYDHAQATFFFENSQMASVLVHIPVAGTQGTYKFNQYRDLYIGKYGPPTREGDYSENVMRQSIWEFPQSSGYSIFIFITHSNTSLSFRPPFVSKTPCITILYRNDEIGKPVKKVQKSDI